MRQKPSCQRCMRWLLPKREDGNFRASHFSTIPRRTSTSARQIASYTDRAKRGQPFSAKDRSNYPQLLSQLSLHKRTRKIKQINPRWAPSSHHTTWLSQKSNTMKENPLVSHTLLNTVWIWRTLLFVLMQQRRSQALLSWYLLGTDQTQFADPALGAENKRKSETTWTYLQCAAKLV